MAYIILLFNNRFPQNVQIVIRLYNASKHIINYNILNAVYIIYAKVKNLIPLNASLVPIYRFRFETTATLSL